MEPMPPAPGPRILNVQWRLVGLIMALALGSVAYRLLVAGKLEQTSALFIGLPTLLALALALAPRAKSPMGIVMKGLTIGLLLSGIVLGEGFICILMAAPLFYLVALIVGLIVTFLARRGRGPARTAMYVLALFLPASLEGTHERLSFNRAEAVSVERVVTGNVDDVEGALAAVPRFDRPLPFYLRLGFPRPARTTGSGLGAGDRRVIRFAGGEGKPGNLVLEVIESGKGRVVFRRVSDSSHVAHWLDWEQAEVRWQPGDPGHVRVVWTLRYTRLLDPAWYFGPWERYAVRLAAGYLADTLTTP